MKLCCAPSSLLLTCLAGSAIGQGSLTSIKVSGENKSFEWFFLLADAGMQQGIWSKNGLDAQFVTYRQRKSPGRERSVRQAHWSRQGLTG